MNLTALIFLGGPITWLLAIMIGALWSHRFRRPRSQTDASHIVKAGATTPDTLGAALLFLSMAYRPNQAFIARAQIREHEHADEDDQGGPDTPQRHFVRQLRRIRRGDKVDRLIWRLQ